MSEEELLEVLPPTVLITSEYDIFRRESYDFADKLKKISKLLDFSDYAEVFHMLQIKSPNAAKVENQISEDLNAMVSKYLV